MTRMNDNANGVESSATTEQLPKCGFCVREKTTVRCVGCGYKYPKPQRVRRTCPNPAHAKKLNVMDAAKCPKCKSAPCTLVEAGNAVHLVLFEFPDGSYVQKEVVDHVALELVTPDNENGAGQVGREPITENGKPGEVGQSEDLALGFAKLKVADSPTNGDCNAGLKARGRGSGIRHSDVIVAPAARKMESPPELKNKHGQCEDSVDGQEESVDLDARVQPRKTMTAQNNMGNCVCFRQVDYLLCQVCGCCMRGCRIAKVCPIHPNRKFGKDVMVCKDCKSTNLVETVIVRT